MGEPVRCRSVEPRVAIADDTATLAGLQVGLAQCNPTSHATRTSWAGNVGLRYANPTCGLPEHRCPSSHHSVKCPWALETEAKTLADGDVLTGVEASSGACSISHQGR